MTRLFNNHHTDSTHFLCEFDSQLCATIMSVLNLPNEVLDRILCYLPLSDLYSASLLSRTWQACVFPHLYNTVYLSRVAHLEKFPKELNWMTIVARS